MQEPSGQKIQGTDGLVINPGQPLTVEQQQIPWRLRQQAQAMHQPQQPPMMGEGGRGRGRGGRRDNHMQGGGGGGGPVDKNRTGPPTRWPSNEPEEDLPQLRAGPDDAFRLDRPRGARMTEKWQKRWHSGGWAGRPYMIGAKPGGQYKTGGEFAQVVLGVFCRVDRSQLRQVFNNTFIGCAAVLTAEQVQLIKAHPDVEYVRTASRDFM